MRRIAIVLCALAFTASDARADILELLKTHKIFLGHGCKLPCQPPPMNPQEEIILAGDVVVARWFYSKTGYIYPLAREEDILSNPMMVGYFRRQSKKWLYLKTKASIAGNTLTLSIKEAVAHTPSDPTHKVREHRIEIAGNSCTATYDFSERNKIYSSQSKHQYACEIVPLATQADLSKLRLLTFAKINSSSGDRETEYFYLAGDRLYKTVSSCADYNKKMSLEFDWRGGLLNGSYECQDETAGRITHNRMTYTSAARIDGNRHMLTATSVLNRKGYINLKVTEDYDVRFVLDSDTCRIEKFQKTTNFVTHKTYRSADSQSECFVD